MQVMQVCRVSSRGGEAWPSRCRPCRLSQRERPMNQSIVDEVPSRLSSRMMRGCRTLRHHATVSPRIGSRMYVSTPYRNKVRGWWGGARRLDPARRLRPISARSEGFKLSSAPPSAAPAPSTAARATECPRSRMLGAAVAAMLGATVATYSG